MPCSVAFIETDITEETGWRGVLQPELYKKLPYLFSIIITAAVWLGIAMVLRSWGKKSKINNR